ncbi:MAG: transposase, partial [Chloroflexota bacterium]
AEEVIKLHNQRGQVENYIKELKSGFGMEWMPCGETYANAVFFRIGVIAYNLFLAMKLLALPPWYRTFTICTMRWRLYQIAGAVVKHGHQLLLKLVAPLNKIVLFHKFRLRCCELAFG